MIRRVTPTLLVAAIVPLAIACASAAGGSSAGSAPAPAQGPAVAASLGIDLAEYTRTPLGLYWKDDRVGTGAEARSNSRVSVAYRGVLASNGVPIDSSGGIRVSLSQDPIIRGWKLGIPGMKAGGARILVIPPELAYGMRDLPNVPPGSTLVFRIQLIKVE
jgi:FKBP-type peptidyl-prolyl cis-trans isomerase FkpA